MADHVRVLVRDAIMTRITGLASGAVVHKRRVYPLQADTELPAYHVHVESDSNESSDIHAPALVERMVEYHIEGVAAGVDDSIDDTLNAMGKEVEAALATAVTAGGKQVFLIYGGCTFDFEDGAKRAGVVDMVFRALIFNSANTPDVLS